MRDDARDLGVEHVARQAVFRDAEAHHAAGERAGFADRHVVAEAAQMIGGGEARGAGADDEHALAVSARRACRTPSLAAIAWSPRKRSTELMPTASSISARLQAVSQG